MEYLGAAEFVDRTRQMPVFDVRTPAEFTDGHLPGAHHLPVFSDDERAEVGTLYNHQGRRPAILRGLEMVGPKMRRLVEQVDAVVAPPGPVLVHCWRGGMRSASVGWLLELYGFEVSALDGGYKAYRGHVLDSVDIDLPGLVVIGGMTGGGKTEVLHELAAMGEQTIDLEGLANHRGSAFGGIERGEVAQQQFENDLSRRLDDLDTDRRIWVEDESRMVGPCRLPEPLYTQKDAADLICLDVAHADRLDRLVDEYGDHRADELADAFENIGRRLGGRRLQIALDGLDAGDWRAAAKEALAYYDDAYQHGLENRAGQVICRLELDPRPDSSTIAKACVRHAPARRLSADQSRTMLAQDSDANTLLRRHVVTQDRADSGADETRSNFIRTIIDQDLADGKHDHIVTRFPPEPNGYLHIGHAKSIVLNAGIARDYDGQFHLRFDDTNPLAEDMEYVESIKKDVAWLGADFGEHLYFASDYFERMYELAVGLIEQGKAYVDSLDTDEIRAHRGELGEPGTPSPYRERSVDQNLDLFERMRAGEFDDGEHVLRAKIDMADPNMLMRDPLLYRIRHATHHRTGDQWCIYPMYDFAHCLEDAFEGVTHSLCTLEFENNRELYDWIIDATEVSCQPRQIEFARLNLNYTIMSKRKLRRLVEQDYVDGWDDPRMPTIAGLRRRGVPPEAIEQFIEMVGVARSNSVIDVQMLEYAIRDHLNTRAPRVMGVIDPLKVVIANYPEDKIEWLTAEYYPHDVPKEGTREVPFGRELYIDRSDFQLDPPDSFWRLGPGREVRLRYGYFLTCDEAITDDDGRVVELRCTYDPQTAGGEAPDGRNPRGTIHWVSAEHSKPAEIRVYDRLFETDEPGGDPDRDYTQFLNPESLVVSTAARVEPSVADDAADTRYQFEREGYFWQDPDDSGAEHLVFNRIVALRDTWAKKQAQRKKEREEAARKKAEKAAQKAKANQDQGGGQKKRPNKKPASYKRDQARQANPELAARLERYQDELGLQYDDADLLSGEVALAEFYEAAVDHLDRPQTVAAWLVNEMLPELAERDIDTVDALDTSPGDIAGLIEAFDDQRITNQVSRQVLAEAIDTGDAPDTIIADQGLERITDTAKLEQVVDQVLADHPDEVERYRGGKQALLGFFIGQVMQATDGTADAQLARQVLQQTL